MNLTINDYITMSFLERKEVDNGKKQIVNQIHSEISSRLKLSLPLIQIDSYNVQSYIVKLDSGVNKEPQYYNIFDHSMLDFCEWFLLALEYNQPNLVLSTFRELKRYVCIANSDEIGAEYYQLTKIFYTDYELEREDGSMDSGIKLSEKYEMMLRFHFFHEYTHYLNNNPAQNSETAVGVLDIIVNSLLKEMEHKRIYNPLFSKEQNDSLSDLKPKLLNYYREEYQKNNSFKEELICDFQSVLFLLELSNHFSPRMIIEAAVMYLYVQYAIWIVKESENSPHVGHILHFRINALFELAKFLNDEEIAVALAKSINRSNQFVHIHTTYCACIDYKKYHRFYNALSLTVLSDRENRKKYADEKENRINPLDDILFI